MAKTNKTVSDRVKLTRTGKTVRRSTSLGHSRANKSQTQIQRRRRKRGLVMRTNTLAKYL